MQDKLNKIKLKISEISIYGEIRNITIDSKYKEYIEELNLHYNFNFNSKNIGEYLSFIIEFWNPETNIVMHYYYT